MVVTVRLLLITLRLSDIPVMFRLLAVPLSAAVLTVVMSAARRQLAAPVTLALAAAVALIAIAAGGQSLRSPRTRALGLMLGLTGVAALGHVLARTLALYASQNALHGTFVWARGLQTAVLILEALTLGVVFVWQRSWALQLLALGMAVGLTVARALNRSRASRIRCRPDQPRNVRDGHTTGCLRATRVNGVRRAGRALRRWNRTAQPGTTPRSGRLRLARHSGQGKPRCSARGARGSGRCSGRTGRGHRRVPQRGDEPLARHSPGRSVSVKRTVIVALAAIISMSGGCRKAKRTPLERGRSIYLRNCQSCHGADGRGSGRTGLAPKNLADPAVYRARSDDELRTSIRQGRGAMPAFGPTLSDDDLDAILLFIKTLPPR